MRAPGSLVAIAAAALVAGCGDSTGPDALQVGTGVTPTQFRAGDPVTVSVAVRNNRSTTITIDPDPCQDPFTITTAAGAPVPMASRVCRPVLAPPRALRPGEELAIVRDWSGDVAPRQPTLGAGDAIAPGEYRVQGFVTSPEGRTLARGSAVTVRVLP